MKTEYKDPVRGENIGKFLSRKIDLGKTTILDIGCNKGAISMGIAKTAKNVVSGDINRENIRIFASRNKQKNIGMLMMDALSLPFKERTFDVVIINGVLEHVPLSGKGNPRNIQLRFLRDVNSLLKKGGFAYIGIENRFSIKYLTGARSHNGMRFIDFLPRSIANFYAKIVKGENFRQYTHSIGAYREMLLHAGFSDVNFHIALPNYQFPEHVVEIGDKQSLMTYIDSSINGRFYRTGAKLMVTLGLQRTFSTNFVILARK